MRPTITLDDVCTYSRLNRRTGYMDHRESIKAGSARRLLEEAANRLDQQAQSRLNPQLTNAQVHSILSGGIAGLTDDHALDFLVARNVIRHTGVSQKEWKALWENRLTAKTAAGHS